MTSFCFLGFLSMNLDLQQLQQCFGCTKNYFRLFLIPCYYFNGYTRSKNIYHHNITTTCKRITERKISTTTQKNTQIYPGKPSWGRKPNKNSSIQMYQKYKDETANTCSFSQQISLSLSPMRYTQVSVCSNEEHKSLFILFMSLEF